MRLEAMKVSTRLTYAFGIVLALILFSGVYSLIKLAGIQSSMEKVVLDNNVRLKLSNDLSESSHIVARVIRSVVLLSDKSAKETEMLKVQKARADYTAAWEALQKFQIGRAHV